MPSKPALDLSHLSPTFLLPTHLDNTKLTTLTSQLRSHNCPLAPSPATASLFLADINTAKRCDYELRGRGIKTAPLSPSNSSTGNGLPIRVVKLKWFTESLDAGRLLPIGDYTVYTATITSLELTPSPERPAKTKEAADEERRKGIMERARRDAAKNSEEDGVWRSEHLRNRRGEYARRATEEIVALSKGRRGNRASTPEYEEDIKTARGLKDMPEWVRKNIKLSCCRSTPSHSPNKLFISHLHAIRLSRILASDDIGVRAYSTAIAVIQAYPHLLTSATEVALLPGCSDKISSLFREWLHSHSTPHKRTIASIKDLEKNENLAGLKQFWSIWGVGPKTAREMWFEKGWKSIDDVVEFGWKGLTRVQQIGVKYYDDFQQTVSRLEAERISEIIVQHAERLRPGIIHTLTGSYRRGCEAMGDVDILFSHPDPAQTSPGFVEQLVASLEKEGWVTYTLHLGNSSPAMDDDTTHNRSGIDGLEKAMVVWQEQEYSDIALKTPLRLGDLNGKRRKNRSLHRRVEVIFAAPECAGAALLAWTGATTFERDLRIWCDNRKWKFTSEGIFELDGQRVGGIDGALRKGETLEDVEKRFFEGLGLEWRCGAERCTG